jgi:hypothetical protein
MGMRRAQGSRSKQRAVISGSFIQFEAPIVDLASGEAVTGGEPLWIAPKGIPRYSFLAHGWPQISLNRRLPRTTQRVVCLLVREKE